MMTFEEFKQKENVQYESIPISKDMVCPECNGFKSIDYIR